jgi:hypothetical protein
MARLTIRRVHLALVIEPVDEAPRDCRKAVLQDKCAGVLAGVAVTQVSIAAVAG